MKFLAGLMALGIAAAASADTPLLKAPLAGIGFLVGRWQSGDGKVADTGGTAKGSSVVTVEANGTALLRRDHTDLFDVNKKPSGGFDQIMLIYLEQGAIRADYSDGQHVIHYVSATVVPGKSVTFSSAPQAGAPTFQLNYELQNAAKLNISFGMIPPDHSAFRPIASGTLEMRP